MRILEFEVRKQRLTKKPTCDFSGLVAGSEGYLHAQFRFSDKDWDRCITKIARFWIGSTEHAKYLDDNNQCVIPPEALTGDKFEVCILGVASGYKIETNKIRVKQEVH